MAIIEPSLSVDEFNEPKVYKDAQAVMLLITRLVLLNPGTIQSHPDMGVGLVENYRYASEDDAPNLKSAIISQISKYLPRFQGAEVDVVYLDYKFVISVTIDNTVFMVMYDSHADDDAIQTKYVKLNEL